MAYLRETCCFDPSTNHWTACAEGPVERAWHGMAAVGGRVYVIGGSNDERGYRRDVLQVRHEFAAAEDASLKKTSCLISFDSCFFRWLAWTLL